MSGKEQWEAETVAKALTKGPERRTVFETTSGIPVERLYTPEDAAGGYEERLGYPGQYPFTRGIQPTMYRGRFWTMRQYAGFATAEESNKRYRYLLEQGRRACPSPLISRRKSAMTRTTPWPMAR